MVVSVIGVALVIVIAGSDRAKDPPSSPSPSVPWSEASPAPASAPGLREASGAHLEDRGAGEVAPAVEVVEASRTGRDEARPVVERFLAAFGHYEVGRVDAGVRAELRATTTAEFGHELLAEPPRTPLGTKPPPPARVSRLQIYLAPEAPEGTVTAVIERGAESTRTTYLLRQVAGSWQVSGVL